MRPMKKFTKFLFVGLACVGSGSLHAKEALDGYLALSGGMIRHMTASDQVNGKDTRYGGRLDFVRLQKNVALDFRFGNGLTYQDFGGAFKLFEHIAFTSSSATGLTLGAGIGAMYSKTGLTSVNRAFYETFAPVFGRLLFDFGFGMGLFFDAEYSAMFQRRFAEGTQSGTNQSISNRYYLGAGLAFSAL